MTNLRLVSIATLVFTFGCKVDQDGDFATSWPDQSLKEDQQIDLEAQPAGVTVDQLAEVARAQLAVSRLTPMSALKTAHPSGPEPLQVVPRDEAPACFGHPGELDVRWIDDGCGEPGWGYEVPITDCPVGPGEVASGMVTFRTVQLAKLDQGVPLKQVLEAVKESQMASIGGTATVSWALDASTPGAMIHACGDTTQRNAGESVAGRAEVVRNGAEPVFIEWNGRTRSENELDRYRGVTATTVNTERGSANAQITFEGVTHRADNPFPDVGTVSYATVEGESRLIFSDRTPATGLVTVKAMDTDISEMTLPRY